MFAEFSRPCTNQLHVLDSRIHGNEAVQIICLLNDCLIFDNSHEKASIVNSTSCKLTLMFLTDHKQKQVRSSNHNKQNQNFEDFH